jgi:hypothetical protein
MKIQDLKNNKLAIIERINEIADTSKMAQIMQGMLNLVQGNANDANCPIALVDEVVELLGYEKKMPNIDIAEINRRNAMQNLPSSMRNY